VAIKLASASVEFRDPIFDGAQVAFLVLQRVAALPSEWRAFSKKILDMHAFPTK
jgi:hypothetical protein